MVSKLGALKVSNRSSWVQRVRDALIRGTSVNGALSTLRAEGYPCARGTLYAWLRDNPDLLTGIPLPAPRSICRGATRPDMNPGWKPRTRYRNGLDEE